MAVRSISSQKPDVLTPKELHPNGSFIPEEDVTGEVAGGEGVEVSEQMTG